MNNSNNKFWFCIFFIVLLISIYTIRELNLYFEKYDYHEDSVNYYSYNKKDNEEVITGDEFVFDTNYYIYYGYLNKEEKELYRQIYANVLQYKTTFKPKVSVSVDSLKVVIESLYSDHPELFYLDTNYYYKYDNNNICVEITMKYNDTISNIENNKKVFDNTVNKIVSDALKYKSDYEKEKYVYMYLINNVEYDNNIKYNQSAYSALILGKSVCAGYARAFQLIMQRLEIPTYYVLGYTKEDHAWNIVKLDEEYYNVDVTWDDTGIKYSHFNVSDKDISVTHERSGISSKLPYCNYYTYYRYQ